MIQFFRSDFCQDYSYWSSKERCVEGGLQKEFTFARRCSTYVTPTNGNICKDGVAFSDQSQATLLKQMIDANLDTSAYRPCLNTDSLCSSLGSEYYQCPSSKTCIKKSKICDGVVHCFNGDDEKFELCSTAFSYIWPKEATVLCFEENRLDYNISILAIPCNNIVECKNAEDEEFCSQLEIIKWSVQIGLVGSMFIIWTLTYVLARRRNLTKNPQKSFAEKNFGMCVGMKGEDLVILKVCKKFVL